MRQDVRNIAQNRTRLTILCSCNFRRGCLQEAANGCVHLCEVHEAGDAFYMDDQVEDMPLPGIDNDKDWNDIDAGENEDVNPVQVFCNM